MISATAEYALRATVYLAKRYGHPSRRIEIAKATSVPVDYLLKVLKALDTAGIVSSRRGPGGGYTLVNSPEKISVLEVILAVDELPRFKQCPLGISNHKLLCPLHQLLDDAAKKIEDSYRSVTIEELLSGKPSPGACKFPGNQR